MITVIETNPLIEIKKIIDSTDGLLCVKIVLVAAKPVLFKTHIFDVFVDVAWFSLAFYGKLEHWLIFGTFVGIS